MTAVIAMPPPRLKMWRTPYDGPPVICSLPSPTPPRGPGGFRAALRALGDAARSPALLLAILAALVLLYAERSSEAIVAIVDRTAGAIVQCSSAFTSGK